MQPGDTSDGILVVFKGGPNDGKSEWWTGADYIEVAELPPIMPLERIEDLPTTQTFKRHVYRIDDKPQDGGAYIARLIER